MKELIRGEVIFLRSKNSLKWLVPGYPNPRENLRCCQVAGGKYYFMEDLAEGLPISKLPIYILAYNDVDILRAGKDFWESMASQGAYVDTGKSKYLKELMAKVCPKAKKIPTPTEWQREATNLIECSDHQNYKVLLNPCKGAEKRATHIYDHIISYNGSLIHDKIWQLDKKGFAVKKTKKTGLYIGNFKAFSDWLMDLPENAKGLRKIEAYINVDTNKSVVNFGREKFMHIMDSVKNSLKLELNFICDSTEIDTTPLLQFKLKGVHVTVPDNFKRKIREKVDKVLREGLENEFLPTVREFYED